MKKDITYQSINQRINQSVRYYRIPYTVEKDAALNSLMNRIREEKTNQGRTVVMPAWVRTVAAAAAVVILVFVTGWMVTTRNVSNRGNEVVSLRLPDHSRVILTAESSVKFNSLFWNRKVNLKGKAYFEVQKGSTFRVSARNGEVEVLGTRFTVDDRDDRLQVVCFEGKVKASFDQEEVVLVSGAGVRFSSGKKEESLAIKEQYPGFARFNADYSNTSLAAILEDLESFFGVRIENRVDHKRYFSGTVNTANLETALSILTVSLRLNYKIQDDQTIIVY